MLTIKPLKFTTENQALIPSYRHKWQQVAVSTKSLDREQARVAVNQAYDFVGLPNPNIMFFDAPDDALNYIYQQVATHWGKLDRTSLGNAIATQLINKLLGNFKYQDFAVMLERLGGNLDEGRAKSIATTTASRLEPTSAASLFFAHNISIMQSVFEVDFESREIPQAIARAFLDLLATGSFLQSTYFASFYWQIFDQSIGLFFREQSEEMRESFKKLGAEILVGQVNNIQPGKYQLPSIEFSTAIANVIVPSVMVDFAYYIDYCHEALGCDRNYRKWCIFNDLITSCGWIFPYEKTVLIYDR